jgi:hypothetical protein
MRTRILARAFRPPDNPRAYVRAGQEEFLDARMLPLEIEEYLADVAEEFLRERRQKSPDGKVTVEFSEQFALFKKEVQRHQLPLAGVSYDRAAQEAARRQGWTVTIPTTNETPADDGPETPSPKRVKRVKVDHWENQYDPETPSPSFCAVCRRTKSWHNRSMEKNAGRTELRWARILG